jgi:hypothetical protein
VEKDRFDLESESKIDRVMFAFNQSIEDALQGDDTKKLLQTVSSYNLYLHTTIAYYRHRKNFKKDINNET